MILLKNINGKEFILNSDLIQTIESIPDTKITLTNNKYYIVSNTAEDIVSQVIRYNKKIYGSNKQLTIKKQIETIIDSEKQSL